MGGDSKGERPESSNRGPRRAERFRNDSPRAYPRYSNKTILIVSETLPARRRQK
jgi:hypothetical protein